MDIETLAGRNPDHWRRATAIRALALDAVAQANSGHSGMPMAMADIATVLFGKHLKFDAARPGWPDRDRFVLSNGHGSMLLYALLHLTGYPEVTLDQLRDFRQLGSLTPGHPEVGHTPGVETTTGPLGQGVGNAVGMAIAEEALRARFGRDLVDHRTWVFAGDGCLMEGISQEAITLAGRQRLSRLVLFWDDNRITIDGDIDLADATDQPARFRAAGWEVIEGVDGHDPEAIDGAITRARAAGRPVFIACRTHIGLGSSAQDTAKAHGALTDTDSMESARRAWGWTHAPFEIPADIKAAWEATGARGRPAREAWEARLAAAPERRRRAFEAALGGEALRRLTQTVRKLKRALAEEAPKIATRKASERALAALNPAIPETFGGSADLTGSNNTLTPDLGLFTPGNRKGRYVHYGVREHGMAGAMNGIALHGGLRPYGGTFLVFSDYARAAVRLAALMGLPVTYVFTHDSIGLGEDGPTHQPVEHLAALRAIPNLTLIRPADAMETAEAWEIALSARTGPVALALTRQGVAALPRPYRARNEVARGAYVAAEAEAKRRAILIATGSEVGVAMETRRMLEGEGIGTRVVSMPSWELFAAQDERYRRRVLPGGAVRVGIEAGVGQGWERWLCAERGRESRAAFIGMTGFGASAPQETLFPHFGLTPARAVEAVKGLL